MIIAVDTETKGLDATQFIMGCIIKETKKELLIFRNKNEMWEEILNIGMAEL